MVGWIILLFVISVVFTALISSLKVYVTLNDNAGIKVTYLGFKLFSYDFDAEDIAKSDDTNVSQQPEKKQKSGFSTIIKKYAEGKNKHELILELFNLFKTICYRFKRIVKHIFVNNIYMNLVIGSPDASDTAILYGKICAILTPIISLMEQSKNFNVNAVSVRTDFTNSNLKLDFNLEIKIRTIYLVSFTLSTILDIIKNKLGDFKNGRK